jgi:hypothetical protein
LSQIDFGHLTEYAAVVRVAEKMGSAPPAYLLDQSNQVPQLKQLLPGVFGPYEPTSTPNLYHRRP